MAIARVQSAHGFADNLLTATVTLPAPPTNGNLLALAIQKNEGSATITLPPGFAWAKGPVVQGSGRQAGVAYKIAAGDGTSFDVTTGDTTGDTFLDLVEISGIDGASPLGPSGQNHPQTTGVTALTTGSTGVLPQAEMYAMGLVSLGGFSGAGHAADSSFLIVSAADAFSVVADKITAATTALNPSISWTTSRSAFGLIATFKGAGGGGSNTNPVANAGLDQSNKEAFTTVTLDGSASTDADGTVVEWTWVQTAGPTVALPGSVTSPIRTFSAPATLDGATLTFGLTVKDNLGGISTQDTVDITVRQHNEWWVDGSGVWQPIHTVGL